MTTTPEERARDLAAALRGGSHQRPMPIIASVSQISLIAQAIREAEDAAISKVLASLREPHGHLIPAALKALDKITNKD